jgi:hypothetical protein
MSDFKRTVLKSLEQKDLLLFVGRYTENDEFYACKITDDYSGFTCSTDDMSKSIGAECDGFVSLMDSKNIKKGLQDVMSEYTSCDIDDPEFEFPEDLEWTEYIIAEVPKGDITVGYIDEDSKEPKILEIVADLDEYLWYGNDLYRYKEELAKKEGGEADRYDFSPIIFFPNGTKFESGCLTEEGFKSIMKRFIPYSRQGKIDKVMDIDRDKVDKIFIDVMNSANDDICQFGTYSYFDKSMYHETIRYNHNKTFDNLSKNEIVEVLKKIYDIDLEEFQDEKYFLLRKESDQLFRSIAEAIIHSMDEREDFDDIMESDYRFEY